MLATTFQILTVVLIIGGLLFAGVAGGKPERAVALLLFGGLAATWTVQGLGAERTPEVSFLLIDTAVAVGLSIVLVRTKLFWAGAACCAQTLMLAFTASRLVEFPLSEVAYVAMLQISTVIVMSSLIYGTWTRRWGRSEDPTAYA